MQILFKKGKDQIHSLTCRREDGSTTWTKLKGNFGPMHDLAHYVVETALGFKRGFYGLLEEGHNITSFEEDADTSWIGKEGLYVESIVMALQYNYNGVTATEDFAQVVHDATIQHEIEPWIDLKEERVSVLQERYQQILFEWMQLRPGQTLERVFPNKKMSIL